MMYFVSTEVFHMLICKVNWSSNPRPGYNSMQMFKKKRKKRKSNQQHPLALPKSDDYKRKT